ncbi:MAG: hypothetical protein LBJ46_04315 [Planctomycetota bacterium]|jgi:hypothetical protein|nr:hypothetical protein [Planctomycetota bacterium]
MPDRKSTSSHAGGTARRLDARLKVLLLLGCSILTQYLDGLQAAVWLAFLCCLFLLRDLRTGMAMRLFRGGAVFAAFWFLVQFFASAFDGVELVAAAEEALPFAGRLIALVVLGIAFVSLTPPVQTGKAVTWFLTPFLRGNAWKAGLALALVSWFLPNCLGLVGKAGDAARMRGLALPVRTRARLAVGAALRTLETQADLIALGLASRRLDRPRVWRF